MQIFTDSLRILALQAALMKGDPIASTMLQPESFRCIAVTAYAEARGEGRKGMALVVQSIVNRRRLLDIPSCKIVRRSYDGYHAWKHKTPAPSPEWHMARVTALNVIMGEINLGNCAGITHFLNPSAVARMPRWASAKNRICRHGKHVGYRVRDL